MATATLYADQETATTEDTIDFETFAHICGIKYIVPKGLKGRRLTNRMLTEGDMGMRRGFDTALGL